MTNMNQRDLLPKSPTGITGLDEITFGGLPKGRTTLVAGSAGSGKTLLGMEFLVKGVTDFNENGVFMAFEETDKELISNVSSLGFNLDKLVKENKIYIDHVHVDPKEIHETGEYDLEGLFIRLNLAIDTVDAKRVVIDTIENLFSGFSNPLILRAELRRLFTWLKNKNVTAIITGERGESSITRQGLEEYVSDCVIVLDHRVKEESSTRRMRIVKYRGSVHGTNEYPFLIDENGISVFPITSLGLNHKASSERISSGISELDVMMSGGGFFRGSTVLISGSAGTGKSSISSSFAAAACKRGEKIVYFSLEESPMQLTRNMMSIGLDLNSEVEKGNMVFHSMRPSFSVLEMHLTTMLKVIEKEKPSSVILDPLNSFISGDNEMEAKSMVIRLVDTLKTNCITGCFTYLAAQVNDLDNRFISSIVDTWIFLRDIEISGERNRGMYILKSRGMAHSNQVREFLITSKGIKLLDVYSGGSGVLTGTLRVEQESKETEDKLKLQQEVDRKQRKLDKRRKALEAKIEAIRAEFLADEEEDFNLIRLEKDRMQRYDKDKKKLTDTRKGKKNP